jgi:hypothetical protein
MTIRESIRFHWNDNPFAFIVATLSLSLLMFGACVFAYYVATTPVYKFR